MSKWEPENRPDDVCPQCHEENNRGIRSPYCGIGDTNYIEYKCKNCGYQWTVRD